MCFFFAGKLWEKNLKLTIIHRDRKPSPWSGVLIRHGNYFPPPFHRERARKTEKKHCFLRRIENDKIRNSKISLPFFVYFCSLVDKREDASWDVPGLPHRSDSSSCCSIFDTFQTFFSKLTKKTAKKNGKRAVKSVSIPYFQRARAYHFSSTQIMWYQRVSHKNLGNLFWAQKVQHFIQIWNRY